MSDATPNLTVLKTQLDGGRFPLLAPRELSPEQQSLHQAIAGSPRNTGPFLIADDAGHLAGPFNALLFAPGIGQAVQALGAALRFSGSLPDRTRELVICAVAAATNSDYEWYAHSRVATTVGISGNELAELRRGGSPATFSSAEQGALGVTHALLGGSTVNSDVHAAALEHFGHGGVTELSVLVGYYRMLAGLLAVGGVSAPATTGEDSSLNTVHK